MIGHLGSVSKTLPISFVLVLDQIISVMSCIFILSSQLLKQLCTETYADYNMLLLNSNIRWLSKTNLIKWGSKLRDELKLISVKDRKIKFINWLIDEN